MAHKLTVLASGECISAMQRAAEEWGVAPPKTDGWNDTGNPTGWQHLGNYGAIRQGSNYGLLNPEDSGFAENRSRDGHTVLAGPPLADGRMLESPASVFPPQLGLYILRLDAQQ